MGEAAALIAWFASHARSLPWRTEPRDGYRSLVSEVMLQQTQVDRVVARFEAFVARFPTVKDLASAHEDEVLELWSGLGYYRRARLLHRMARVVCDRHGGAVPADPQALRDLPGVGEYTAAAVASMVYGRRLPVVDGNIRRVGCRYLAHTGDPRSAAATRMLSQWVLALMSDRPPGVVNEALMELGATLCAVRDPGCAACPLAVGCRARASGRVAEIPAPRTGRAAVRLVWVAACCVRADGCWLVRQVSAGPILRGLWLPPLGELSPGRAATAAALQLLPAVELDIQAVELRARVRHAITHRRIEVVPVRVVAGGLPAAIGSWRWIPPEAPGVATSTLLSKLWRSVTA